MTFGSLPVAGDRIRPLNVPDPIQNKSNVPASDTARSSPAPSLAAASAGQPNGVRGGAVVIRRSGWQRRHQRRDAGSDHGLRPGPPA